MKNIVFSFLVLFGILSAQANEGMWIPILIEKQIIDENKAEGFLLDTADIYSVNKACLKDAVMVFGGGCTAEFISDEGLILTNHHCGFSRIQALSSVEHDYLTDGYWAMSREEELPAEDLSVKVLNYMEDVTEYILQGVTEKTTWSERNDRINKNIASLEDSLSHNETYHVEVKPFYFGNQYLAFVSTEYNDVRLVGAPPSSIGKFGGDTDNWMWPRHGGDFSLFRLYADKNNKPAYYKEDNRAFQPKKSLDISLKGVNEGDFTFVLGYPGSTDLYATSYKLKMLVEDTYPVRIGARSIKLNIMNKTMEKSPELRLKYAAKSNSVSNTWKRWQGEIVGIDHFAAIEKKIKFEKELNQWINNDGERAKKYGNLFQSYKTAYEALTPLTLASNMLYELYMRNGMETVMLADIVAPLDSLSKASAETNLSYLNARIEKHFKDFDLETDKALTKALLEHYLKYVPQTYIVDILKSKQINKPGGLKKYVDHLFKQTYFADSAKLYSLFKKSPQQIDKAVAKDPATILKKQLQQMYADVVKAQLNAVNHQIDSLNRLYISAIQEANPNTVFPADANSTLRLAYGHVGGFSPKNGIIYQYYTTIDGIMEKNNPNIYDYQVPERLKALYRQKDFGQYTNANGELPVCFLASNHTTGGNSGSPLLNRKGQLVGLNFDRVWEGVMSDLYYSPEICRNISVDIRYVLFIIDKFAGAGYLLDEMNIVR